MVQKSLFILFIIAYLFPSLSVFEETNENTVSALLTAKVTTSEEQGTPISNARIIVVNPLGEIIATELTNSEGQVNIPVVVQRDPRFPMKNMGEVTVIAVADGYNEYINFSVPINEFNDNTGKVFIPLWNIDPARRNEPQFLNGSFHRFTVFEMLDYYAEKIGLKRQDIKVDIGKEPPWSSGFKVD
ncbi:carboxypeptidase regulatory-like domain-containing protein [Sporosarcina sp. Marseille-Q4063]|uniref:carboxypeptidase-like regulatory domain-containing protein n=1 Tax=Sporosarcina sp. Marseille-Q4063 TaxID=2810514 RepID=UPI001BAF0745|nr:carboxypeptidase-like regulatory domain-containing protein [Sporosarcina sp. Marseille-Q4063]QUW23578.1 carboxypeptidase regulatory-like domain-containing protein [Sporosarcina sp. Marseille-Q4063]